MIFKELKKLIFPEEENTQKKENHDINIAFGVLLFAVAESDGDFSKDEMKIIREILEKRIDSSKNIEIILKSIEKADENRIDIHEFTRDIDNMFTKEQKINLIEELFRVACTDRELKNSEIETIRTISSLFHLHRSVFIDIKVRIMKEYGL